MSFFFSEAIPSKPWSTLINSVTADLQKHGFNSFADQHEVVQAVAAPLGYQQPFGFPLQINMPGNPTQFAMSGRNFQSSNAGQVREEVHVHRNRLEYIAMSYERWTLFRARAETLLINYIDTALQSVNIVSSKLEYWDRFVFDGPQNQVAYAELIRKGSTHVPSFPFDTDQLWHSHAGYFRAQPAGARRLVNVNVDAIDVFEAVPGNRPEQAPLLKRSLGFYSMAQDTFAAASAIAAAQEALSTADDLHTTLKEVFADVITSEAADRISLLSKSPS